MSRDVQHILNGLELVYTQRHCEAHDVWHSGNCAFPAGKTVLCVIDTRVGRTANYGAYGKIRLWHHVCVYPPENCYLFLDWWLFCDTVSGTRWLGADLLFKK
jgi:hypothetical protein